MTGPRIALVALALIAVLFFAGVGMGFSGEGSGDADLGWVESLSGMLTPSVDLTSVTSTCLDAKAQLFALPAGSTCAATIPGVTKGTRRLNLKLTTGTRAVVTYTAPSPHEKIDADDQSAAQTVELAADKTRAVIVLKEGGALAFSCTAPDKTRCEVAAE